jgi:glycosyltransferase involved in cell wall biosynthesis
MSEVKTVLSIVIPCYNEQENVGPLFKKLRAVLDGKLNQYKYEMLFIDDGSKDSTLFKLHELADDNAFVKVISLSRNFGKEIATSAGIKEAKGEAIIIIDADGQHPPSILPTFVKSWEKGSQVVTGVRINNQKEGIVKRYGSNQRLN